MFKTLIILFVALSLRAQSLPDGLVWASVEFTNVVFPVIRSTNGLIWEECGYLYPIPDRPRAAMCFYRVGIDWDTNFSFWATPVKTTYIWHTNSLLVVPKVVYTTQDMVYYKPPTKSLTKPGKLNTTPVVYKSLPPLP